MHYFFLDPSRIAASRAVLEGSEAAHLKNVLRLTHGDLVGLVDGSGYEYQARVDRLAPGRAELCITARRRSPGLSAMRIDAAQGYLKDKKMDRVVRQLAELGITRFIPLISERAVTRPEPGRASSRRERWRKIAVEALKQCRRGDLMGIADVVAFGDLLAAGRSYDLCVLFWERAAQALTPPPAAEATSGVRSVLAVLGPEGGFSEEEAAAAQAAGFRMAKLGPRILRAETAAVAACAVVQYLFGDLGAGQKSLDKEGPTE